MSSIGNSSFNINNIDLKNQSIKSDKIFSTEKSIINNDNFKNDSYTLSRGISAVAKIAVGVAAGDLITRELYPNQKDKRIHSMVGGVISGVTTEVTTALTDNKWVGIAAGIGASIVAGSLKEFVDSKGYGTPDKHDFYATALGGTTVGFSFTIPF